MSDHLPECPASRDWWRHCVCQNLRDYVQRALGDAIAVVGAIQREDGGYCHVLHACDVEAALESLRDYYRR